MTTLRWHELPDGARLPWLELGDPAGPPLVAMPGLNDGLAPLSEPRVAGAVPPPPAELSRYRTILLAHRHPLPAEPTTTALAGDVAHFLAAEVARPVLVSGHSMGAMVAQHLTADHPELVAGLVLSAAVPNGDPAIHRVLDRWDRYLHAGRWEDFHRDALAVSYTAGELLRRRLALRLSEVPRPSHQVPRHVALARACRAHDARGRLGRVRCPTLVLAGERDPLTRPERAAELAQALPNGRLEVLAGVAHGFPEQVPVRYTRLAVEFAHEHLAPAAEPVP